jgi:hypothetical protein
MLPLTLFRFQITLVKAVVHGKKYFSTSNVMEIIISRTIYWHNGPHYLRLKIFFVALPRLYF